MVAIDVLGAKYPLLKSGSRGHNVQQWQKMLNSVRKRTGTALLQPDGAFGPKTRAATVKVQKFLGVTADGIAGSGTITAFKKRFPMVVTSFTSETTKPLATKWKKEFKPEKIIVPKKPMPRPPIKRRIPTDRVKPPPVYTPPPPQPAAVVTPKKAGMGMGILAVVIAGGALLTMKG